MTMSISRSQTEPLVSFVIPMKNAGRFIRETLESIKKQTYLNWEVIIVDDCSDDDSVNVVETFSLKSVYLVKLSDSRGVAEALNVGLTYCQGKYIARIDADDICMPDRLDLQVAFMESNPDIAVCGSSMLAFEGDNEVLWPAPSQDVKMLMLRMNPIYHPTVMFRSNVVPKIYQYQSIEPYAEDFELWTRIAISEGLTNLPQPLVRYRLHSGQISITKSYEQAFSVLRIRKNYASELHRLGFISYFKLLGIEIACSYRASLWRIRLALKTFIR
jgi:glycosyltransferase involved in cell wall biosynthesis